MKKSRLDSIDVAKPCNEEWDKMIGRGEKRFCLDCKKDVYNLSAMSRRKAKKLIAKNGAKICVRYARMPNGKLYTTDQKIHQITRRSSTIAAGVIATTISLSAMTYAQGQPFRHNGNAKDNRVVEQVERQPLKDEIGTSQISFTVFDFTGAVIPGAEIELTDENNKATFKILSNEDGSAQFSLVPKGRYKLVVTAPNFRSAHRYVRIHEPIEPNIHVSLDTGMITGMIVSNSYEIPFFEAIAQEDNDSIRSLIASGFDVNTTGRNKTTALHVAVELENLEVVELLLRNGAKVNAKDEGGRTPLLKIDGDFGEGSEIVPKIVRLLISKGADVNVQDDEKRTLLMQAAYDDDLEIVELLLKAGADPNLVDEDGETAFANADSDEIKLALLRYGARK